MSEFTVTREDVGAGITPLANDRQVGGDHYKKHGATGEQHWDRIVRLYPESFHVYFVAAITKYVERYRDKNGLQDLAKAKHYLDKLIEEEIKREERKEEEQYTNLVHERDQLLKQGETIDDNIRRPGDARDKQDPRPSRHHSS